MTLAEQLAEAETALHHLAIGKSVTECRDSNGEMVRYTLATRAALLSHNAYLKGAIADIQPVRSIQFSTSKGV